MSRWDLGRPIAIALFTSSDSILFPPRSFDTDVFRTPLKDRIPVVGSWGTLVGVTHSLGREVCENEKQATKLLSSMGYAPLPRSLEIYTSSRISNVSAYTLSL